MVGQQPVLMHLIRLLALVIIAATTSHAQDVAYCQAPHSLMGDAQGILLQATGSLPTGAVLFGQSKVEIFQQDYISFGAAGEFRLGLAFNPNQASQAFYPPGGADFPAGWERHILSSPGDSPLLLAVGPAEARLFSSTGNSPLSFPSQALGRLLATSSPRPNQAILLTLLPNSFFLLVHMFANSSHHKEISPMLPGGVLPGSAMRAARAADPCVFYIWQHKNLLRLTYSYDDNSVDVDRSLLNAVILDLVPTRLSSDTGPDSEDLLLLMEGGHWHVLRDGQLPVNGALGEGMPQPDFAPGQILAPFSHELVDGARTSIAFYRDDGIAGPKFWRLEFAPSGTLIRVRSVLFPTGATDLEALRPMFLRIDDSDAVRLVLANSRAYFDPVDFGCGDPANTLPGDESITCLSSSSSGWTCNTGRVPGIFGKGERLCNACRDGFGAFLNPNGACSTPNCATCDSSTGECLVCLTGYLVVISDQTFCLESCPTGLQPVGNVCQDASIGTRIQSDVSFTQATVSGTAWNPAGQDPVDVLLPTVLLVQAGAVYLPWSQDVRPPRLLGLRSSGLPLLITPMSTVAEENLQSVDAIAPGNWPSMGQSSLRGAIEILQPSSESGYHDAVVVYCSSAGLSFVWLKCLSVPVGPVGTPCKADLSLSSQNERPCDAIAAFADGRTIAVTDSTGTRLFRFSSGGSFSQVPLFGGPGLPVLLPGPSSAGDAQLMVLSDSHGNLTVSPLAMHLANDLRLSSVRMNVFARNKPAGLRPLVLPTPSRAGQSTGDFLASCLEADPNGMGTLWTVSHLPGGWAPRGQTAGLPSRSHTLLALADTPDDYRIEAVPLEGMPLTPGMLVLMVDRFFAMAILHCEPDRANCFFLPARKVTLPEELLLTAAAMFVAVPSPSSGITPPMGVAGQATSLGPSILTASFMVLLKDNVLPFRVDVTVALCPGAGPGIYLPDCLPCHDTCHTCFGSLPSQCIECHLAAPGHLPGVCLASCPAGLHQVPNTRTCDCHQDCDQCEADTSLNRFYCTDCAVGLALDVSDPLADRCLPCHDSCRACRFPDDEAACDGCALGFFEHGGLCLAACPPGTWANGVDRKCSACPDGCTACTGTDACSACSAGWYHDPDASKCHACPMTCDECTSPGVCSLCRPGLVFLSPNPSVGSLCGSTCAPGEYVGPGRCMACDGSCALCTGGPAVCSVCPGQADTCALCERGWLLASPACVDSCPAGSSPQGGLCVTCHPTCDTCYGPGADQCTSCGSNHPLLVDGRCLADCPAGSFSSGHKCIPCHASCEACSGPGPEDIMWQTRILPARYAGLAMHLAQRATARPKASVLAARRAHGWNPGAVWIRARRGSSSARGPARCMPVCTGCEGALVLSPVTGLCAEACAEGEFLPSGQTHCLACHASCRTCIDAGTFCTSCPGNSLWLQKETGICASACPGTGFVEAVFPGATPDRVCLACPDTCEACTTEGMAGACKLGPSGRVECPVPETCTRCALELLLHGGSCVPACPSTGFFADWEASPAECAACHDKCRVCSGPSRADCLDGPGSSRGRLALGLGLGLGLLLLLLLLVVLFFLRRRLGAASKRLPPTDDGLDENATVMNTILELSLPGSIMVNIGSDFARLNEASLGAGAQASVFGARAVGAGISDRLGCPGTVAIKQFKTHRLKPTQGPLFQNEIALMWLLRDMPGVVRLYGYSEQPPAIVMERFDTDLHNLLHSEVPLPPAILCAIVEQWTAGLEAMHAQGIAHRDIKSGNVFVSRNADGSWRAALGDLGASRSLSTDRSSALVVDVPELNAMTARYAAPEVLAAFQRRRPLDTELYLPADIYSAAEYRDPVSLACLPCHSACATCNGPTDHDCWRCADSVLQDGQCLQSCAPKHVATSGRCLPCHPSCAGCFGTRSTECHDCLGGLLTLPAGGPAARCVAFCPVGYSTSTAGCSPCGAHCSSCPGQADTWRAALGDLGASRSLSTDRSSALVVDVPELNAMTARYAAPEVLAAFQRRRPLDTELYLPADIYSAAVLLWECLHRRVPWQGQGFEEITAQVLAGGRPSAAGRGGVGPESHFEDLLQLAWDSNAHARPLAASLRQKATMARLATHGP
ncbi:serine/threonine protein kinase [Fonticula alba]|uniref:Serine/threonine protein kinase n=1 Tax=Fonticula alba TaxID=691883 RepID=A0A058Z1K2_FONAL|nr:serine/threonine protein kinase [Fonticula alba]KCV68164.1 serine/threonine protein kinase [Fonticula alba]|eukprot:XP_009497218.1 serine/threonine protein kinase [Fonticula alba]